MSLSCLILTRPEAESITLARALKNVPLPIIFSPVMQVFAHEDGLKHLCGKEAANYAGLILTSRHAVTAMHESWRNVPAYVVGEATADAWHTSTGEKPMIVAANASELAGKLRLRAFQKPLLYARGKDIRLDIRETLSADAIDVEEIIVYEAQAVPCLAHDAEAALSRNDSCGVLLYSPRSAGLWLERVAQAKLLHALTRCTAFCLSAAVAGALEEKRWGKIVIADAPTQAALLLAVDKHASAR